MKRLFLLVTLVSFLTSCNVTESIVFNEDGSGQFLVSYEMGEAMRAMTDAMGGGDSEKKEGGEVMDTTMVFADIMETYKDSIATLPEEKRLAMEAVKDMFMTMKMNEAEGEMNIGIGLDFKSIADLKDINEKMKNVQRFNGKSNDFGAMKESSPFSNFMDLTDNKVKYNMSATRFSRVTKITKSEGKAEDVVDEWFNEENDRNQEFRPYFENTTYTVKLTFPKAVKSISVKDADFSDDRKTVTYKTNWIEYLKNPKLLDTKVEFVDE